MRAHEPEREPRSSARGRGPAAPRRRPGIEALLRLSQVAGNAAVTRLVVQRISLTETDKKQLAKLKKADSELAEAAIAGLDEEAGGVWWYLTTFTVKSKVPAEARDQFLADLYRQLGKGRSPADLRYLRDQLDRRYGDTIELPLVQRPAEKTKAPPSQPGRSKPLTAQPPPPSLGDITTARKNLRTTPQPAQVPAPTKVPVPATSKPVKPPGRWAELPAKVQSELLEMWDAWQGGKVDANGFYDLYKESNVKADLDQPSGTEYAAALKAGGLLGEVSEQDAIKKGKGGGYPVELKNKGGTTARSRVYLNPHPQHVVAVYAFVKTSLYPLPGVIWVKLADHSMAMTVRDVIVMYLSPEPEHAGTEDEVVNRLAQYQKQHRNHFVDEVPRLAARRLPGVGVGDEPPSTGELGALAQKEMESMSTEQREAVWSPPRQFSFSQYRSELIVRALEDARGKRESFQELVADYFARAGLDVSEPARQKGLPDQSAVKLLGLIVPA